jgi:hypothetical protein
MKKFLSLLIIFIISSTYLLSQNLFLNQKPYYRNLFNLNDLDQLNIAFEHRDKSVKYIDKTDKFLDKATVYEKKAALPISQSKVKRFKRKALKYKKKAAKYEIKADKIILDANNTIKQIYLKNLRNFTPTKEIKILTSHLQQESKKYLDSALTAKSKIAGTNDILQQADLFNDAKYFEQKALLDMEYQFALQADDKQLTKELLKKYKIHSQKNKKDTTVKIVYNPAKDAYLYYSKNQHIDEILNYSQNDENLITQYYNLGKKGFLIMKKANSFNDTINKLTKKISATADFMQKRELVQKRRQIINQKTQYQIEGLKNYIAANKDYYDARQNHINDFMPKDTNSALYKEIKKYEKKSDLYLKDSETRLKKISVQTNDDTYKKILASNDQVITALAYQENAFDLMMGNDTQKVVIKHKIIETSSQKKTNKTKVSKKKENKKKAKTKKKTHKKRVNRINGLFVYSYENPRPHIAETPKGVIYRVQVGQSKYILPVNELREYDKIYFETYTNTNVKNFLVGDYRTLSKAKKVLMQVKAKGYTGAYIVKYVNGLRKGAKYYSSYKPIIKEYSTKYNAENIRSTKYLVYFVQIGTFSEPKTKNDLKNLSKLYYKKLSDGRVQYFVGPYYRYSRVRNELPKVRQKGFTDAIIVAYNNGQQIDLAKARKIEQSVSKTTGIYFSVQVGVYSDYLPQKKFDEKFGKIKGIYLISSHKYNGLVIYTVGKTQSFAEAKKIRKNIANLGFGDSFVVAFKGGKKIPLSEALK